MAIGAPAEQAGAVKLLLIGDSHGLAISGAFDEAARSRGVAGWAALRHGVLPIPVTNAQSADPLWTQSMVEWAGESKVTDVVLCARWMGYLKAEIESRCGAGASVECEDRVAELFASHLSTVHQTLGESGIRLWILSEVPDAPHPMFAAVRARVLGTPLPETGIARATHEANQRVVEKVLSDPRLVGIRVWDLSTPFFEQGGDGAQILSEQGVFYVDGNHLSTVGASFLVPHLSRLFSSMTGEEHEDDAQPVLSEGRIGDAAAE